MKVLIADDELINKREKEVNEFDVEKAEHLKENFLKDWMIGKIRSSEIEKDMRYFNIKYTNSMVLIVIKPLIKDRVLIEEELQTELISYAIYNIANDIKISYSLINTAQQTLSDLDKSIDELSMLVDNLRSNASKLKNSK